MRFEAHPWVPAGVEEERGLPGRGVDVVVVGEFREWEKCVPVVLAFSNKDPQVLLQFLVDPFGLPIRLGAVEDASSILSIR